MGPDPRLTSPEGAEPLRPQPGPLRLQGAHWGLFGEAGPCWLGWEPSGSSGPRGGARAVSWGDSNLSSFPGTSWEARPGWG